MDPQLKLHGGHAGNLMLHHPLGASLGAMALAGPVTWIATGAEGAAVGVVMGLVGLVMGAPLGAMLADSATREPIGDITEDGQELRGFLPRHH